MNERPDLRDLIGEDVSPEELDRVRRAHDALRATPAPPEASDSLSERVLAIPEQGRSFGRSRVVAGFAVAAAIAGAAFGIGWWVADTPETTPIAEVITLDPTASAPSQARMVIEVLPRDDAGNWAMSADVSGLPPLPEDGYYELWMTKDGELVASCGRFVVDERGEAEHVWLNAPYQLEGYDRWVVVAVLPGKEPSASLLDGPIVAPA